MLLFINNIWPVVPEYCRGFHERFQSCKRIIYIWISYCACIGSEIFIILCLSKQLIEFRKHTRGGVCRCETVDAFRIRRHVLPFVCKFFSLFRGYCTPFYFFLFTINRNDWPNYDVVKYQDWKFLFYVQIIVNF